jgi:formamidopyrimidine-DNA glycosylase
VPELPEIQAHAERLTEGWAGAELTGFTPLTFTALKTYAPKPEEVVGRPLEAVRRRGKHLMLAFGDRTFVVHLMQGGRLKPDEKLSAKPRFGIARWRFGGDRPALLLTEAGTERKAGVWVVADEPEGQAPLEGLGPDADALAGDAPALRAALDGHKGRIHGVLRDQHVLAGIGRRLANEICHRAKLSPFAGTAKLGPDEVGRLAVAMAECIEEGLAAERLREDMSASKERPGAVHGRTGQACPVCGDQVRAVEYNAYTVNYCATCQTGGKVLADNTTSKFLK